ncbi:phytase [Cristinia sonorae]|uniref:Phytase A n=1 Tax=Cristinia sonorae TaxID=1940300 RepID=A0A8K0UH62_9AGAR|nr:phytase [Cristinia sonorae]
MAPIASDDAELERGLLSGTPTNKSAKRRRLFGPCSATRTAMALIVLLTILAAFVYSVFGSPAGSKPLTPTLNVPKEAQLNWAQYSPYFPVDPYRQPPQGCNVEQVNILQRHGARFPTSGAAARIKSALDKLLAVREFTDHRLDFLRTFQYDLGTDDLVPFGAAQSFDSGAEVFERYANLVSEKKLPFVRASSSERVVMSALNWTQGFSASSHHGYNPTLSVILSESSNDTLDDNMCPAAGSSDPQTSLWLSTFAPPITQFLNRGAPHANLTDTDTFNLISVCPFETVSEERRSKFCDLFATQKGAFPGFAYSGDLDKFYGTGYGQELGPVQGVGYVNELIARLTGTPVQDHTQTNHTLDSDPTTFPLNRTIYADFSHDNQMIAIFSAMGLFRQSHPLNPTKPDPERDWKASGMVPFSARMVVERLRCGRIPSVRILVNQQVQPLEFCGGDRNGICSLDAFVKSQTFATSDGGGDFEKCFA